LVQDEALKRADARIRQLEAELGIGAEQARPDGFLDDMRSAVWGRREAPRAGSVPSVRPADAPMGAPPGYQAGMPPGPGVSIRSAPSARSVSEPRRRRRPA
jgi:hypothetical protein